MVEKKTVAIAVLCVIMVLCLGLWANEAQEANRLEGELWELEGDYEKLAHVRTSLEENYSELRTEKEDLETEHSTLETDYFTLQSEYESLKDDILGLSNTLSLYADNYRILEEDYDELNSIFEEGKAIAESAEWISEDERLKVTSELIPEFLFGTVWEYTVRVTITNVGDEPIDRVVILVFPYKDGMFAEASIWTPYESHTVENIYIGETYSHDFKWLPKDMTSYKVLAVTG